MRLLKAVHGSKLGHLTSYLDDAFVVFVSVPAKFTGSIMKQETASFAVFLMLLYILKMNERKKEILEGEKEERRHRERKKRARREIRKVKNVTSFHQKSVGVVQRHETFEAEARLNNT
jgi:hypothetical protein